jgi:DNA-binding MarR family transcriptional regulator
MDDFSSDVFQIINTLTSISEKYQLIEKNPHVCDDGTRIYPSQIRSILMIGHNPGINVTELGKRLEISKSSASEFITKLGKCGLVRKARDVNNSKEVLLFLTEKGRLVMADIDRRHAQMFQDLKSIFGEAPESNYKLVAQVLNRIDYFLEKFQQENR